MTTHEPRIVRLETLAEEMSKNMADIRAELRSIRGTMNLMWGTNVLLWLSVVGLIIGLGR